MHIDVSWGPRGTLEPGERRVLSSHGRCRRHPLERSVQGSIMDDLTHQAEEDARVLGRKLGLSRRQLLAAPTGMAAAAMFGLGTGHAHAQTGAAAAGLAATDA